MKANIVPDKEGGASVGVPSLYKQLGCPIRRQGEKKVLRCHDKFLVRLLPGMLRVL